MKYPAILLFLLFAAADLNAQVPELQPGKVTEHITSFSQPSQKYALFLPTEYTPEKHHPIVFILDPRQRALFPLMNFKDAADSLGYILISSYNSRSDGDPQINIDALNTMINDAFQLVSVDTTRFYLAGFSGTARMNWSFGFEIPQYVAGIISYGAGMAQGARLNTDKLQNEGTPFSFYGATGYRDFNYFELVGLDYRLESARFEKHITFFDGGHHWPPVFYFEDALYWMEIMAMKEGLVPRDKDFIHDYLERSLDYAQKIEARGDYHQLYRFFISIRSSLEDLTDTRLLDEHIEHTHQHLGNQNPELIQKLVSDYYLYVKVLLDNLRRYQAQDEAPTVTEIVNDLKLSELLTIQDNLDNLYKNRYTSVVLETIFSHTQFYQTRQYLSNRRTAHALAMIQVAEMIKPDDPRIYLQKARIFTQKNDFPLAYEALEKLKKSGRLNPQLLQSDPYLAPLRDQARFKEIISSL